MSTKETMTKLPRKAGGTEAQPTMLTKVVAALIKSDLKESVMRAKGMAIVPSISNWIQSKWSDKPAKHLLRAAVDRGTQICVLQKPAASRNGLNGSIKIHPKFAKLLEDRDTSGDNPKEVANAIAAFIRKPRSQRTPSPEPKPAKPKKKAVVTAKKPKTDFPVATKKQATEAVAGTSKKRSAKAQDDEPKAKKAKK